MPSGIDFNDGNREHGPSAVVRLLEFPRQNFFVVHKDPTAKTEAINKAGRDELNRVVAIVSGSQGDDRVPTLSAASEYIGQLHHAGVLGAWSKNSLSMAAGSCGLSRDTARGKVIEAKSFATAHGLIEY